MGIRQSAARSLCLWGPDNREPAGKQDFSPFLVWLDCRPGAADRVEISFSSWAGCTTLGGVRRADTALVC